jgi:HlyD family secretion protein
MLRKLVTILAAAALLVLIGFALYRLVGAQDPSSALQTEAAMRGDLKITVDADGAVRSNQVAALAWHTSGRVDQVDVQVGDQVSPGQVLARLEPASLSQAVILAQADLVEAQRELERLRASQTQAAQAAQAVEQALRLLEDARNPQANLADAQKRVAETQKALELARDQFEILSKPVPQSAIDQAGANLKIAKYVLDGTLRNIERINKKLQREKEDYFFFEDKELYKDILKALENKRDIDQRQYDDALEQYNQLLEPPDPLDLAVAEGNVILKQAELQQALLDFERLKDGPTPGEIAVLEARLADAQRERQRLANGPAAEDIAAVEARLAAAQAAIQQIQAAAPITGTVTAVYAKSGDQITASSPAFRIDDLSRMLVDARLSEVDINKIRLGQSVILTFDSIPDREYQGRVVELPAVGQVLQDILSFNVVVEVENPDEMIRPGITAKAAFITDDLQDVLLVPNRALRLVSGERVVYVLRDGAVRPVPVTLGAGSELYTQVLSGDLQAGDEIVLNPKVSGGASAAASQ